MPLKFFSQPRSPNSTLVLASLPIIISRKLDATSVDPGRAGGITIVDLTRQAALNRSDSIPFDSFGEVSLEVLPELKPMT